MIEIKIANEKVEFVRLAGNPIEIMSEFFLAIGLWVDQEKTADASRGMDIQHKIMEAISNPHNPMWTIPLTADLHTEFMKIDMSQLKRRQEGGKNEPGNV